MNDLIGSQIKFTWNGEVFACVEGAILNFIVQVFVTPAIGKHHKPSQSILSLNCTAHLDIEERDLEWERNFQVSTTLCISS